MPWPTASTITKPRAEQVRDGGGRLAEKVPAGELLSGDQVPRPYAGGERLPKKLASFGFGRRATPAQKTLVVQKLRQKYSLNLLLSIAQLPRATFYYHVKQMQKEDRYASVKEEITTIYHEKRGGTAIAGSRQNFVSVHSL